jgi:hypothetical protein
MVLVLTIGMQMLSTDPLYVSPRDCYVPGPHGAVQRRHKCRVDSTISSLFALMLATRTVLLGGGGSGRSESQAVVVFANRTAASTI